MTIPTMMNCGHRDEGWCLACVRKLEEKRYDLECRLKAAPRIAAETMLKLQNSHSYFSTIENLTTYFRVALEQTEKEGK